VAVGDRVFASPTLDVIIFVVAAFEEDGGIGVGSVAGRLASSCNVHYARNPTWVLVVTCWPSAT
jgi:hypothetical protein